jgi:hypothetical protein
LSRHVVAYGEVVRRFALISTIALALPCSVRAQSLEATPPRELPPHVARVEDVLVPVASEVFTTLDRFKDSNWRAVQRQELATARPRGDQASIALLLGAVIAEGFIAVAAEDANEIKNLGRSLLTLARGLGVEPWALKRSRSIVDHAESGDWAAVRKEWDQVLPDVHEGMKELKSQQLAHLVSLGGWVRGSEALSVLVSQRYSSQAAELLRQPVMLDHFEKQLAIAAKDDPALSRSVTGMQNYRRNVEATAPPLSPAIVKEIGAVAAELRQSFAAEGRLSR